MRGLLASFIFFLSAPNMVWAQFDFQAWRPTWGTAPAEEPQIAAPLKMPSTVTELPPAVAPPPVSPESIAVPNAAVSPDSAAIVESHSWLDSSGMPLWFTPNYWDGSFEVGINGTEGNAEAFSFRTGGNLKRKIEQWEFTSDIIYAKSLANGIETQHNAIFNSGYELFFGESPWSHFGKMSLEYDEFKAFDMRLALNAGLGYQFLKTDITSLKGRFGAGVSHEFDSPDDRWVPEAVFGGDYSRQISKRQKLTFTTDYYPEWEDFNSYRLVTNLGWELFLDESSNLSLKLSVNDRYDSTPNGRKPNDVIYSLLLLWKI
jgi:putative salt-induced outer membrane protein YdiY